MNLVYISLFVAQAQVTAVIACDVQLFIAEL